MTFKICKDFDKLDVHVREVSAFESWTDLIGSMARRGYIPTLRTFPKDSAATCYSVRFLRAQIEARGFDVHPQVIEQQPAERRRIAPLGRPFKHTRKGTIR